MALSHENSTIATKYADIIASFKAEVCDNFDKVDLGSELDFYAISLGYFIAKGISIDESHALSIYVRYTLQYWEMGD